MDFGFGVSMLLLGCIAFAVVWEMSKTSPRPAGLRGQLKPGLRPERARILDEE